MSSPLALTVCVLLIPQLIKKSADDAIRRLRRDRQDRQDRRGRQAKTTNTTGTAGTAGTADTADTTSTAVASWLELLPLFEVLLRSVCFVLNLQLIVFF